MSSPGPAEEERPSGLATLPGPLASPASWGAVLAVAALLWAVTLREAIPMGGAPGTMGLAAPVFLGLWALMMAAMMLPATAPVAGLYVRAVVRTSPPAMRAVRVSGLLAGYLLCWALAGIPALGLLAAGGLLAARAPLAADVAGVVILAAAGVYQFSPWKSACLRHCRSPLGWLLTLANRRGPLRDVAAGLQHGAWCIGCCWMLMAVLCALGMMQAWLMAALAAVVFAERVLPRGRLLAGLAGVALLLLAAAAVVRPELLGGLHATAMSTTMGR